MPQPLTEIRNLGPASAAEYARAGIPDAETLRSLGADVAYARLLLSGVRPHFIGYYALVMGLQGRPWSDCQDAEKDALRVRFEQIKKEATGKSAVPPGIERILDEIGVLPHPR